MNTTSGNKNRSIVKRTKFKNRMQITAFAARLSQHKRQCSEGNTGNVGEVFVLIVL